MQNAMIIGGKTLYTSFLFFLLFFEGNVLGIGETKVIVALIGAICGSLMLTYFRANLTPIQRLWKMVMSAIGGMFAGAMITEYFQVQNNIYISGIFFVSAFIVLILLRSLLTTAEQNADGIITTIVQKVLRKDANTTETKTKVITTNANKKDVATAHKTQVLKETESNGKVNKSKSTEKTK